MTNIAIHSSGLLLMISAVLLVIASLAPDSPESFQHLPRLKSSLVFLSSVLLLLCLPAMYARQANEAGWLGLIGHALLQTGMLLYIVVTSPTLLFSSFDLPFENNLTALLLGIALTLGWPLTAIATIRAGVYPRWAGILLFVVTAGFFFGFFIAEFLPHSAGQVVSVITSAFQGLALAWIGLSMWRDLPPAPIHLL